MIAHGTLLFTLLIMALHGPQRLWSLCGKKPQCVAMVMMHLGCSLEAP